MDFPGVFSDHILPHQLHKINLSFIVSNFEKRRGGTAGNVSYTLGLLKTKNILFSVAGNDFKDYKSTFKKCGISTDYIKIDNRRYTATGFAMTDKNDNQIWGYFYGAAEGIADLKLSEILSERIGSKDNSLILVGPSGSNGSLAFVHQCIESGFSYMFDPGFILTQISDKDLEFGVKNSKYIVGNDYEIEVIKKRVKNWKQHFSGKIVITTQGEKGAKIFDHEKEIAILAAKAVKVIDPTGAGDAWRAGFLAGLERGFDLQICGQMGSVSASFAVEKYGTQEHSFTLKQFKKRYKEAFGCVIEL